MAQEGCQVVNDLLGFGFRAGEPAEMVIGVPDIAEQAVAGIIRIPGRRAPRPDAQVSYRSAVTALASASVATAYPVTGAARSAYGYGQQASR